MDYVLGSPEVNGERLAAYGISAGGYAVTRVAAAEKRLRAVFAIALIVVGVVVLNVAPSH